MSYYKLDPPDGGRKEALLTQLKAHLAAGIPLVAGFTVYGSIAKAQTAGKIPFPAGGERVAGAHAVAVVGYDDSIRISNEYDGSTTQGALLVRNSRGVGWGDRGYGWLPYEYVFASVAIDFWAVAMAVWLETGQFGL